jgi:hypothetical protein
MYYWEARAIYADGTEIEKEFRPYENENYNERQYDLEWWLLNYHDDCIWYSVNLVNE